MQAADATAAHSCAMSITIASIWWVIPFHVLSLVAFVWKIDTTDPWHCQQLPSCHDCCQSLLGRLRVGLSALNFKFAFVRRRLSLDMRLAGKSRSSGLTANTIFAFCVCLPAVPSALALCNLVCALPPSALP